MLAYVRDICGDCGNLRVICSDPNRPVYPQKSVCYVTAVRNLTLRQVHQKYGDPEGRELHPMDGVTIWASPENLTPGDDFI